MRISDWSSDVCSSDLSINAGSARAKGVEVDGIVSPTSALRFAFGLSYLEQKYVKLEAPAILAPFFKGAEGFTGSPKWSYQAAIDYDLPLGPSLGKVTLHADHYYIGKY